MRFSVSSGVFAFLCSLLVRSFCLYSVSFYSNYSKEREARIPAKRICYGHFGVAENPVAMLKQHRDQLLRWREVIAANVDKGMQDDPQAILSHLLFVDPLMADRKLLSNATQNREQEFC